MALTPSNMLPLGTAAPDFSLTDVNDSRIFSLSEKVGYSGYLVFFICNHCPYVIHIKEELKKIFADYSPRGVCFVAINANDYAQYTDDSPEKMKAEHYPFPYLIDETQAVAKSYQAACTPDFYLFDKNKLLVYRGQLDDSRPGNHQPSDGKDLRAALDALLAEQPISKFQKPSIGCNIKWK